MCGRFVLAATEEDIERTFDVQLDRFRPRYNIAPGQQIFVVASNGTSARCILEPIWGLRRRDSGLLINIRSETIAEKPAFRRFLHVGRCVVPASGFFEWSGDRRRQPYYITAEGMPLLGFAAVFAADNDIETGRAYYRCALLTRSADSSIAQLHDRMPVVVPLGVLDLWLSPECEATVALDAVLAAPDIPWRYYAVSKRVGSVANDDPSLLLPIEDEQQPLL